MDVNNAITWMMLGAKLQHSSFSPEEWVAINKENLYQFEDGVECTPEEFWNYRKDTIWLDGWDFFGDPYIPIASRFFGVSESLVTKVMRNKMKSIFFSLAYSNNKPR